MNPYNFFACLLLVLCGAIPLSSPAAESGAPDLAERLAQAPPAHPRLFLKAGAAADLKAKIEGDALLSGVFQHLMAAADALLEAEPVKRIKEGKRLLGVSRTVLQRVSYLAFAYRMTGDARYLRRAEKEMLAVAAFEDWNPSHFLDVAEMTTGLAVGYDWLYDDLDPAARAAIRDAIIKKGLEAAVPGGSWVKGNSNWNQVCNGGIAIGALAVLEDCKELATKLITRSVAGVPHAMDEYGPDGVYPEGPSYWAYGTTYNVLLIDALESALGSDFGLATREGFRKTPDFYLQVAGPTGLFFNFSDCGLHGGIAPAMHWFAQRLEAPGLLWQEKRELEQFVKGEPERDGGGNRMLAFLLLWAQPLGELSAPQTCFWKGGGRTPVAMLRSAWQEDATYVALKAGSPSANHAHMDVGSFVLDMQGLRWALDFGSQGYYSLESKGVDLWNKKQDSERWTVFRLNNTSHNTLVVDGQLQLVKGSAPITRFSDDPARPFAVADISPVYEGQLAQAGRGVCLLGESVLIQDEIRTLDRATSVRWAMATQAEVTLGENGCATLRQQDKVVSFRALAPADAVLAVVDVETPPREFDAKNPNTRMITFEVSIPASAAVTWVVFLEPGNPSETLPEIKPLESW